LAHFNHKIRTESDKDQDFVEQLANGYELDLELGEAEKEIESEEEARKARFNYLFQVGKKRGIKSIALAQNKSDQTETVIHNFVRGAGVSGLSGIKPIRKAKNNINLIRPLLCLDRKEIIGYLDKNNLKFVVDKTNLGVDYTRNKIRHQIVPALKNLNPNLEEGIANQAEIYQMIDKHLTEQARLFLSNYSKKTNNEISFSQPDYLKLNLIIQYQVIREVIKDFNNLKNIGFVHLGEINKVFNQQSSEEKFKEFKGLKFVKQAGRIRIVKRGDN
jgi:tRNA(Ile)-lysidine synthetase-like protein